ncbi:MAG: glycoside hydrolase family 3 N-terminal domain-containing protein [Pseudomonadota bacterium]
MATPSAVVFDTEGAFLTDDERAFFREANPWGFFLFARHCETLDAALALTNDLRDCVGREAPIFIDQEGGRVARMRPPAFRKHPPPGAFGALWRLDPDRAKKAARLNARLLGAMVADAGVTFNCVPSLDAPQVDSDPATLGDRTFAVHPDTIAALGLEVIEGTMEAGVTPVIKHMPGLGRAQLDSHLALPFVSSPKSELEAHDYKAFIKLASAPAGMTCHVVFEAIDKDNPVTFSSETINAEIRAKIGFDGLLLSDDLKMKALEGTYSSRVDRALKAGCDVAICCNLNLEEKINAAEGAAPLSEKAIKRAARAEKSVEKHESPLEDREQAYAELAALLKPIDEQATLT